MFTLSVTLKLVVVFCKYRQRDGQVVGHKPASRRLKELFITFGPLRALSGLMHNQCPINSWSISNKPRVPEIHSQSCLCPGCADAPDQYREQRQHFAVNKFDSFHSAPSAELLRVKVKDAARSILSTTFVTVTPCCNYSK